MPTPLLFALALPFLHTPQDPSPEPSGVVTVPPELVHPGAWRGPENVGRNVRMNQDATTAAQNEYSMAINPLDLDNVVGAANDYRTGSVRVGAYASFDGGRTFVADGIVPLVAPWGESGDPAVAFDRNGNLFVLALHFNRTPLTGGIYLHRSSDGGRTFGVPIRAFQVAGNLPDKPYLAIDQRASGALAGSIYLTFTGFTGAPLGLQCIHSRDGGQTWSSPVPLGTGQGTSPAVGPNGEVYVAWQSGGELRFNVSTDGGVSFQGQRTIAAITANPSPLLPTVFRCNSFPSAAVDNSSGPFRGRVHVSWSSRSGNSSEVFAIRSVDGGNTWSAPVRINDAIAGDQFFQWITVDEAGTVFAGWHDRRNDPANRRYDCYASASYDGGATWIANWRVSDVASDPGSSGFIGDYGGICAGRGRCFPAWCDIRSGNQDAYTAPVQADLELSIASLSATAGGTVALPVKVGPRHAGQGYFLVANFTGTTNGAPLGAATWFLNYDALSQLSLQVGNLMPFLSFQGFLGAGGMPAAQPSFAPSAGLLAPLVGRDLNFACLIVDGTPAFTYGTNPVTLRIAP
jgi:hypothetical protein